MEIFALLVAYSLTLNIDSLVVTAQRIREHTPVAYCQIDAPAMSRAALAAASLPQQLALQSSVVAVSECGTGVGYSSFSVRGVGAGHTSVTLNGINLGDAESQQVFWVNIPALDNILSSMQLQRGLGTAACGPGAFGAALNMQTLEMSEASGSFSAGFGSFGTYKASAKASSGMGAKGFFADASMNWQHTGGYLRNAPANVGSLYLRAGKRWEKDVLQAMWLMGKQRSAITWNGVPFDIYPSDRRYNVSEGDTDNFTQNHLQTHWTHEFSDDIVWRNTADWTHGMGWYEIDGNSDYLSNDLLVGRSELQWNLPKAVFTAVAYVSNYNGAHFGRYPSDNADEAYSYRAVKGEADFSARAEWMPVGELTIFGEAQYRGVKYEMFKGGQALNWNFFNPRIGINYSPSGLHKLYCFAATGHREPARADLEAVSDARPERMWDFEMGYKFASRQLSASVNLYHMGYRDMLLETGELDSQGYQIKKNIPRAFRSGIETAVSLQPFNWLKMDGNLTWSVNRISASGAPLLLSPGIISALIITVRPLDGMDIRWNSKWVGSQHYDNTGSDTSLIPSYSVSGLSAEQAFRTGRVTLKLGAVVDNIFNREYYAYACAYGVFPAAPLNFAVRLSLSW